MWNLYRRGRIWWARRTVDGVKQRISLDTEDRKIAEAKLRQRDRTEFDPRHHASHSTTLADALKAIEALRLLASGSPVPGAMVAELATGVLDALTATARRAGVAS